MARTIAMLAFKTDDYVGYTASHLHKMACFFILWPISLRVMAINSVTYVSRDLRYSLIG